MPVAEEAGDDALQEESDIQGNGESGALEGDGGDDAEEEAERQRPIRDSG